MATDDSISLESVDASTSINIDVTENPVLCVISEDTVSCATSENFVDVNFKTFLAHESLKSKVEDFLKKLQPFVELLEENRDSIDKSYTKTKKITLAGSTVSAVGGGLTIAGTAGAPATFGGSLALSFIGGALIATGTATSMYFQHKGSNERKTYFEMCIEEARELEQERDDLKRLHEDYIQQCELLGEAVKMLMTTNTSFQINSSTLKHILMGMHATSCNAIGTTTAIKAAAITPGVVNTGHIIGSSASIICKIVQEVGPTIALASKIISHVGVALGSIGVLVDIVIGIMALVSIIDDTKCPESKTLTRNIKKSKEILKKIQTYYDYLAKEPEELFKQADNAIQVSEEQQAIEQLKQENENLREEIREQQLQFEQKIREEQEKQKRQIQQVQQQMQQLLQQQKLLNSQ